MRTGRRLAGLQLMQRSVRGLNIENIASDCGSDFLRFAIVGASCASFRARSAGARRTDHLDENEHPGKQR